MNLSNEEVLAIFEAFRTNLNTFRWGKVPLTVEVLGKLVTDRYFETANSSDLVWVVGKAVAKAMRPDGLLKLGMSHGTVYQELRNLFDPISSVPHSIGVLLGSEVLADTEGLTVPEDVIIFARLEDNKVTYDDTVVKGFVKHTASWIKP